MLQDRNPTIDAAKGVLILLVMVGHLFIEGVGESPVKWMLYGFHMPLFMALSGYLIDLDKLRATPGRQVLARYWRRMGLPWILVAVAYTALTIDGWSARSVALAILQPLNHLWFVPVLAAYIAVAYWTRASPEALAVGGFGATLAGLVLYQVGRHEGPLYGVPAPDFRYAAMAFFFFLGVAARNPVRETLRPPDRRELIDESLIPYDIFRLTWLRSAVFAGIGSVGWLAYYWQDADISAFLPYLFMNVGLVGLLIYSLGFRIDIPVVRTIGIDSLYFYLWHPFIFAVAKLFLYPRLPLLAAYAVTLLGTITGMFIARIVLRRVPFLAAVTGVIPSRNSGP